MAEVQKPKVDANFMKECEKDFFEAMKSGELRTLMNQRVVSNVVKPQNK